jgi:SAM-dependent methyltransferase
VSIGFYDENAEDFFARTKDLPPLPQLARFTALLPPGGRVLDAGCGSGRDARLFRQMGFQVTATEAAPRLAALASGHAGVQVLVKRFDEMAWREAFDGVWACASLLHIGRRELVDAVGRLRDALVPGGALFMSFKYGSGEREADDRRFTDLDEAGAAALLAKVGGLALLESEVTGDIRPDKAQERWLSLLAKRA